MTIEELLKPRYKVIADWPSMRDFSVDQIVVLDKKFSPEYMKYEIEDCQGVRSYITKFFEMYPHLFKPLSWWEERKEEDMPKYIRLNQVQVVRVARHFCTRPNYFQAHDTKDNYPYEICKPATKEEYLSQHTEVKK